MLRQVCECHIAKSDFPRFPDVNLNLDSKKATIIFGTAADCLVGEGSREGF